MRPNDLIPAVLLLGLAGCQLQDLGPEDGEYGVTQQKTIGGVAAQGQPHYEAVAAITVLLPLENKDTDPATTPRTEYRYCTGVLIEARTVMTAAGCLARNLEFELEFEDDPERTEEYLDSESVVVQFGSSASAGTEYYLDASLDTRPDSQVSVLGLTMHRYYNPDATGLNDIALLRLSADPGITPVAVNGDALTAAREGTPLELVGYGRNDELGDKLNFTARNVVSPIIDEVSDTRVTAGSATENTCYADQGGPGFLVFDDEPKVATVSVMHRTDNCTAVPARQRVDLYYADFIEPFIKFHSGGCDVADACVPCDYNGVCAEDCPTRDWDCPLSAFPGDACNISGDCEEGGSCVPAGDDPSFTYCDKPCNADVDNSCPSDMQCQEGTCVYAGISPGSQGASCSTPADCRSGYCENTFCAFECDASDPNACDSDNDFFCLPASEDGTPVCRKDTRTGGGGFCAISPAGSQSSHRNGFLVCFGLVFLVSVFRRRRFE